MSMMKAPGREAADKAFEMMKNGLAAMKTVQDLTDSLLKEVNKRLDEPGRTAKTRGAKAAVGLVKVQQVAVAKAFKIAAKVQQHADSLIKDQTQAAPWLPPEGKDIINEWSRMLGDGREEFQKTVDKSYSLLCGYLDRVSREGKPGENAPIDTEAVPIKPAPAKRKAPARKKTASKKTAGKKAASVPASVE